MADDFPSLYKKHSAGHFLTPSDLSVQANKPKRVLLVGSCLAQIWRDRIDCPCDFVLTNNLSQLPENPPQAIADYDLQIVQLPLRSVMPDATLWGLPFPDYASHEKAFETAVQRLRHVLATHLAWNVRHKIVTFCMNFLVPQRNPMGQFTPRYDLRNPVYFVEQLNFQLAETIKAYGNVYILDIDEISSVFGKKSFQDDAVAVLAHGSLLGDGAYDKDMERIEPISRMTQHYELHFEGFIPAVWEQAASMYKTLHQEDAIKVVIVDLDNTLWRGVIAEGEDIDGNLTEGWPIGLVEALAYLKKRGIVLAIASQNEESTISKLWPQIMRGRFALSDFAVVKINWSSKVDNIKEILKVVNVLPRHALFIDDNPVERARVQSVFPDMRVLGKYPYYLKRILLWSPELQVPLVTTESSKRTDMIQAQVLRETVREELSRDEFLSTLEIVVEPVHVMSVSHASFPRALELINKTNQFNTTGKRWTSEECRAHFARGNSFVVFTVKDRFSDYGLVCCAIVSSNHIEQFVMSCRVIGLDVEMTAVSEISEQMKRGGAGQVYGHLIETKDNFPCRDLFEKCGFERDGDLWTKVLPADGKDHHDVGS